MEQYAFTVSDRGFRQFKPVVTDHGHTVRVYESSAAEKPCLWLNVEISDQEAARRHLPVESATAHLTLEQATTIRDMLDAAIAGHYQTREEVRNERDVVCEQCGEIIETEPIGGPDDRHPELGDADRIAPMSDCGFCAADMD